ncbi:SDR family NAD(P)-dependent oxidoreductase [Arthrobacter sp. 2MCAF15]|uniref:SDR family NAD(P)-dependent oxidoreductase n=1 Tax=Arthrobacter sp. 2MCAF15 TaxID=3232984 RepID=UPI003F903DDC
MTRPADVPETLNDYLAKPSNQSMRGRTALVAGGGLSGSAGSIGFSLSWLYATNGARVAVFDRDKDAAQATVDLILAEGGEAFSIAGDASQDADCERAVTETIARYGTLDALATTIGRGDVEGIFDVDRQQWDDILTLNLTTAWQLMRHASPVMPSGSSIVTTSSGAATSRGPGMPYSVAKAGLEQLTVGAAATLAPKGIRVNAVRVGTIWSTFAAQVFDEDQRATRANNVALQMEGNVWDIASAALFLSGERARWITGQIIAVDGGGPVFRSTGQAGPAGDSGR